mgnify:CR=1 FL=1
MSAKHRVGITFSAFDLLHAGHITMLEEAKRQLDVTAKLARDYEQTTS